MEYEVIVERRQPSCGGKDPKKVTVLNVSTDSPEEYVKAQEHVLDAAVSKNAQGETVIEVSQGAKYVKYTFTED